MLDKLIDKYVEEIETTISNGWVSPGVWQAILTEFARAVLREVDNG